MAAARWAAAVPGDPRGAAAHPRLRPGRRGAAGLRAGPPADPGPRPGPLGRTGLGINLLSTGISLFATGTRLVSTGIGLRGPRSPVDVWFPSVRAAQHEQAVRADRDPPARLRAGRRPHRAQARAGGVDKQFPAAPLR